jgi:hypothetical protein
MDSSTALAQGVSGKLDEQIEQEQIEFDTTACSWVETRDDPPSEDQIIPTDAEILEWVRKIQSSGTPKGYLYTNSALKYWVRFTFGVLTPEYKQVAERIDALVQA